MIQAELEICRNVCSGDTKAFEQFFRRWWPVLNAFSSTLVRDESLAKDIVQDSFVELWKRAGRISSPASLTSYIFTIVKNRCCKEMAKRRSTLSLGKQKEDDLLMTQAEVFIERMTSLDVICRNETNNAVAQIIDNLPEQSRKVMKMRLTYRMTCKEIADALGLSTRTVENEYFRAVKAVRDRMRKLSLM